MVKFLVTGANQGLGYYLVEYLLSFPNHQVFLGSRSVEKGEEAAKKLRENPQNDKSSSVKVVQIDVSSDDSINKAAALDDLKELDALINNAGIAVKEDGSRPVRQVLEETYQVNVFGVASTTEAFIPALKKSSQKAVIVNVSSELGSIADRLDPESPYYKLANEIIAYSSSKTALNGITAHYTRNLPEMRVVSVTPGYCATALNHYSGFNTPQSGAEVIGKAALDKDGETGVFLSPEGDGSFRW